MEPGPQEAFTNYPRGDSILYGTGAKLDRLYRGYQLLSYSCLILFATVITTAFSQFLMIRSKDFGFLLYFSSYLVFGLSVWLSIRAAWDLGEALGWPPAKRLISGLVCPFSCLIGYVASQSYAIFEFQRYGISRDILWGIKREDVRAKSAELLARESLPKLNTP